MVYPFLFRSLNTLYYGLPHGRRGRSRHETLAGLTSSSAGFSILEIIVVVVIIGTIAAVAAPSWLALVNRQRLGTTRDEVLQAIRSSQGSAKQTRRPRAITFDPSGTIPKVNGVELGSGNLQPNMVTMAVTDKAGDVVSSIEFDEHGAIDAIDDEDISDFEDWPINIVLSTPPNNGPQRCIFVDSLLASTRLESNDKCDLTD